MRRLKSHVKSYVIDQSQPHVSPSTHVRREKRGHGGAAMIFAQCSQKMRSSFFFYYFSTPVCYVLNSVSRWAAPTVRVT